MKDNILLWGLLQDGTMRSVYDHLQKLHAPVLHLNHVKMAQTSLQFFSNHSAHYLLEYEGGTFDLNEFSSAYLRPYNYRDYSEYENKADNDPIMRQANLFHHIITSWADSSASVVVNKPSAEASNNSKLYQALYIHHCGFLVPDSLVTNNIDELQSFHARHGEIIYKSMSSVRSIVKKFSSADLAKIKGGMGLIFFQQFIAGKNIRVHVVGEKVFSCLIESDADDYRYAPSQISEYEIPYDVQAKCILLAKKLGLVVSGIDFIVTPKEEWYCLEANPSPGFSYYDISPEKKIAKAVAEALMA
jgi:glutathione synthase/RimK-type ligase-like ATP-grasp enzyme